jgi:hypothetical protein
MTGDEGKDYRSGYLTIVTSGKYSKERFIKEALKLGVSRAISLNLLKKIVKERLPIFLAEYKDERVIVFGFFYPDGFSARLKQGTVEKLEREGKLKKEGSYSEIRGCGVVAGEKYGYTVSMEEILDEIELEDRKVLARGRIHLIKEMDLGFQMKFRGYKKVKIPRDISIPTVEQKELIQLEHYELKKNRESVKIVPLEYIG